MRHTKRPKPPPSVLQVERRFLSFLDIPIKAVEFSRNSFQFGPIFDLMAVLIKTEKPRVVDLGCGTGLLTAELSRYLDAQETIGIDSSKAMLATARSYQTGRR